MDIVELVRTRYTTKHYDPARRISDRDIADLMEVLRLSPSSVNSQPWHFFVTGTDEGKARVMPAVLDFNRPRVADASHLVVFAVPVEFTEERFRRLVAQELADGRVTTEDAASGAADAGRRHFVGLHQVTQEELLSWETRQAYIAMGFLLWAAAERGIDSTCLEGLDMAKMDECLGLAEKGLRTVCAVSLGYRLPDDSNAALQGPSDSISNQDFTRASPDEQAVHFSSFRSDGVRRAGACRRFGRRQVRARGPHGGGAEGARRPLLLRALVARGRPEDG